MSDLDAALRKSLKAQRLLKKAKHDCAKNRHMLGGPNRTCKHCHVPLCDHHMFSLRGCMLPAGHEGLHNNPWACIMGDDLHWNDSEGVYVTTKAVWVGLVSMLGKNSENTH